MKYRITILFVLFTVTVSYCQCLPEYGFEVRQFKFDSTSINYIDKGVGQPILMIHGLGGNASHWKSIIENLSTSNRCIAIDLPGYGGSDIIQNLEPKKALQTYANIAVQLLTFLKLNKVTLMGHSMGGQVALILALQEPTLINQLILISPAGLETFTESESAFLSKYTTPSFYESQDSITIERNYKANFYRSNQEMNRLIQERINLKKCVGFSNYCSQITLGVQGMLSSPVKSRLPFIQQKTLIVFGENDSLIPNKLLHPALTVSDIANIGKLIPNVAIAMIPEAGHLLPLDQPAALTKMIKKFIP